MEYMLLPLKRYADFSGRSRRMEYWMFYLLHIIVFAISFVLIFSGGVFSAEAIAARQAGQEFQPGSPFWIGMILLFGWIFGTLIPTIAVHVRRFHDQDKSGWFYLLSFIPFGGLVVLVFMFMEGTAGPNQYGPDPKGNPGADVFR